MTSGVYQVTDNQKWTIVIYNQNQKFPMKTSEKYFHLWVALRPGNMSQNGQKHTSLWHHSQKTWNPKPKIFHFIADMKTCQIFWRLELLSSAISWVMPLLRHMAYAWFVPYFQVQYICRPAVNVLSISSASWQIVWFKSSNKNKKASKNYVVLELCVVSHLISILRGLYSISVEGKKLYDDTS